MRRVIYIIAICVNVLAFASCGTSTPVQNTQAETQNTQSDIDAFIDQEKELLAEGWGNNYEIVKSDDGKGVLIKVWSEGMSNIVVEAVDGNTEALKYWYSLADDIKGAAEDTYWLAKDQCGDDVRIIFAYMDEFEQDKVLIAYEGDGTLVTDIVDENR